MAGFSTLGRGDMRRMEAASGAELRDRQPENAMNGGASETGPALESHYRFLLWLAPPVERFTRSQKFLHGDRIQGAALDVLEDLATYTRRRDDRLAQSNLVIEKLRFLFRLDLRCLDPRRRGHAARTTN